MQHTSRILTDQVTLAFTYVPIARTIAWVRSLTYLATGRGGTRYALNVAASECLEIEGKRKTCMYEDPVTKQKGCERLTGDRAEGVAAMTKVRQREPLSPLEHGNGSRSHDASTLPSVASASPSADRCSWL